MGISYDELTIKHPCFAKGKKGETGRIHLPISPGCNIEYKFCDRQMNNFEKRTEIASTVIAPKEAIDVIRRSLDLCKVSTVAGSGDALARHYALETIR